MDTTNDGSPLQQPGLVDLQPECIGHILSYLPAKDLATAAAVQRSWREQASDERLWQRHTLQDLAATAPEAPGGCRVSTYREAYAAWQKDLALYGPLLARAKRCWSTIEAWTQEHVPEIRDSLRPGASEAELNETETALGCKLPPAFRALYRLHDGQHLHFDQMLDTGQLSTVHPSLFHGLFGGYSFYDRLVCTRLMSLARIRKFAGRGSQVAGDFIFAASFQFDKTFIYSVRDGRVCVSGGLAAEVSIDAQPADLMSDAKDGILTWFEEYARRLQEGVYVAEPLCDNIPVINPRGINLFPSRSPLQVTAVTRGVRVQASSIFVAEAMVGITDDSWLHTYRISFALLAEEEQAASWPATAGPFRPLHQAQLMARHWIIRDSAGAEVDEVRGEAVVGHYPILTAGGPPFSYQSCTYQRDHGGCMEGDFHFVEGTIARPTGPEFDVECSRFMLEVPKFKF